MGRNSWLTIVVVCLGNLWGPSRWCDAQSFLPQPLTYESPDSRSLAPLKSRTRVPFDRIDALPELFSSVDLRSALRVNSVGSLRKINIEELKRRYILCDLINSGRKVDDEAARLKQIADRLLELRQSKAANIVREIAYLARKRKLAEQETANDPSAFWKTHQELFKPESKLTDSLARSHGVIVGSDGDLEPIVAFYQQSSRHYLHVFYIVDSKMRALATTSSNSGLVAISLDDLTKENVQSSLANEARHQAILQSGMMHLAGIHQVRLDEIKPPEPLGYYRDLDAYAKLRNLRMPNNLNVFHEFCSDAASLQADNQDLRRIYQGFFVSRVLDSLDGSEDRLNESIMDRLHLAGAKRTTYEFSQLVAGLLVKESFARNGRSAELQAHQDAFVEIAEEVAQCVLRTSEQQNTIDAIQARGKTPSFHLIDAFNESATKTNNTFAKLYSFLREVDQSLTRKDLEFVAKEFARMELHYATRLRELIAQAARKARHNQPSNQPRNQPRNRPRNAQLQTSLPTF